MRKIILSLTASVAMLATFSSAIAEESNYLGNFEGFYAGVLGGATVRSANDTFPVGSVIGGYRWHPTEIFALGVETELGMWLYNYSTPYYFGSISAQAGLMLGNNLMTFVKVGAYGETNLFPGTSVYQIGAGLEFAANNVVNIRVDSDIMIELFQSNIMPTPTIRVGGPRYRVGLIIPIK